MTADRNSLGMDFSNGAARVLANCASMDFLTVVLIVGRMDFSTVDRTVCSRSFPTLVVSVLETTLRIDS